MQNMLSNTPVDTMRDLIAQNMKTWDTVIKATVAKNESDNQK